MNIAIDITAIVTSVAAAFLLSGGRNAGTPFETASTPVIAVQPFENAVQDRERAERRQCRRTRAAPALPAVGTGSSVPVRYRQAPTRDHREDADDEEVRGRGEQPARFAHAAQVAEHQHARRMPATPRTVFRCHAGMADVIAATPAAMLTDTVST